MQKFKYFIIWKTKSKNENILENYLAQKLPIQKRKPREVLQTKQKYQAYGLILGADILNKIIENPSKPFP